ncbi:MAG TPA: hypothetical protein VGO96_04560 [Pyrinomonadaceae bacterium]|nr:hypothetical protein [Pyrinomonadaceae bacterium]
MKKLLALTLSLASIGFVASSAEAKTSGSSNSATAINAAAPATVQWRRNDRRNNRRVRTVTQSRLVRVGRRTFRETYQITYLPNGRTQTRLISRVRVR